jgi:phosphatidylglycerol:prolipoprotein diacylglycerol transferase
MGIRQLITKLAPGAILTILLAWWLAPYFRGTALLNPVWLSIGNLQLYWYGLLMTIAVLLGFWLVLRVNQTISKLNPDNLFYVLVTTVISGFIGARLMFVLLEWPTYSNQLTEIWHINHGGMSIHGALIGGVIGLWLSCRWYKLNSFRVADLIVLALPIGQAIGRFGNFINQEAFGGPTSLPWKMFVAPEFRPPALSQFSFFHPTFLYEAIGDLMIAGIIWRIFSKHGSRFGLTAAWYLLLYSGWRFIVEWWRIDSVKWEWLTLAQWASLAIIIVTASWLIREKRYGRS